MLIRALEVELQCKKKKRKKRNQTTECDYLSVCLKVATGAIKYLDICAVFCVLFAFRLSFSVDLRNAKEARKAKIMHFWASFCTTSRGIMFNLEL